VLPYTFYKTSDKEQSLIFSNVDEVTSHITYSMDIVSIYYYKGKFADIGCFSEQTFYYSNDKVSGLKFNCQEELTGLNRFSVRLITHKPNVDESRYQGVYGRFLKSKDEVVNIQLRTKVFQLANLSQDELLEKFNYPERVLKDISFLIVDKLFPGKTNKENETRLSYLRERSENRRLRMLKKYLLSIQQPKVKSLKASKISKNNK
jgi:hypothetical protein